MAGPQTPQRGAPGGNGAWDDLGDLEGHLTRAIDSFEAVQPMVTSDIEFVNL